MALPSYSWTCLDKSLDGIADTAKLLPNQQLPVSEAALLGAISEEYAYEHARPKRARDEHEQVRYADQPQLRMCCYCYWCNARSRRPHPLLASVFFTSVVFL